MIEPEGIVIDLAKKRMQISACEYGVSVESTWKKANKLKGHVVVRCAQSTVVRAGVDHACANTFRPARGQNVSIQSIPQLAGLPKGRHIFYGQDEWTLRGTLGL